MQLLQLHDCSTSLPWLGACQAVHAAPLLTACYTLGNQQA